MKKYKKIIVIGLIGAMALTAVGCGEKKVENTDSTQVESTQADIKGYDFDKINEKPEILKEFTNMDADYAAYLKNTPFEVVLLDAENNMTDEIMVYNLPESQDATALYLYTKEGKVVNAKLDAFNGDVNLEGYTYDTVVYNYNNMEKQTKEADFPYDLVNKREDAEKELKAKFEGKSLNDLQEVLKVYTPVRKFSQKDTGKSLEVYMIVSEVGYTASATINVIVKDNNIEKLYIDESYQPEKDPIAMLKDAQ